MARQDYEIPVRPLCGADRGGYVSEVPELRGCMSDGETPQEALENVYDAILCWVDCETRTGHVAPVPRWTSQ